MALRFSKMHGLGNDFIVLDARSGPLQLTANRVRAMADRRTGVGFDQLLIIEPARDGSADYAYSIRNADGSPAHQCGNGVRCIAAWLRRDDALRGETARLRGPSGVVEVQFLDDGRVAVDMGEPVFDPARVRFDAHGEAQAYALAIDGESVAIGAVSMGNPHAVVEVDDVAAARIDRLGPLITAHPRFPQGANAGFAQALARDEIRLRVHERGAGWTRACGTGACAAMAVLHRRRRVDDRVRVRLPGGMLDIEWRGPGHALWMTGPAAFVFDGEWLGA
ncbi:MAG: diaminopimelate epimerase [Rhodanobacteraceae bacterium]